MKKVFKILITLIVCLVVAILAVVAIQTYIATSIEVKGDSMLPTVDASGAYAYYWVNYSKIDFGDIIIAYVNGPTDSLDDCPSVLKNNFSTYTGNIVKYVTNLFKLITKKEIQKNDNSGYTCVIKRVIGLPGDTISIENAVLYRNGEVVSEDYLNEQMKVKRNGVGVADGTWILDDDEYFILGDNRNYSYDSEDYGPIKDKQIYGKVWLIKQGGKMQFASNL